jgi:hypothetical protein
LAQKSNNIRKSEEQIMLNKLDKMKEQGEMTEEEIIEL